MVRKEEFVLDDMFVEGKVLLLTGWVVSGEEVEIEEMIVNGDVENEANAAHYF